MGLCLYILTEQGVYHGVFETSQNEVLRHFQRTRFLVWLKNLKKLLSFINLVGNFSEVPFVRWKKTFFLLNKTCF